MGKYVSPFLQIPAPSTHRTLSGQCNKSHKLLFILFVSNDILSTAVAQWLRCCATNRKVAGSIPSGVTGIFHWHKILPIALWPWGQLSLKQKWVPRVFPGGKGGRCVRLTTLPPSCGNLNFLEPSGPLYACNGTALPLPSIFYLQCRSKGQASRAAARDAKL